MCSLKNQKGLKIITLCCPLSDNSEKREVEMMKKLFKKLFSKTDPGSYDQVFKRMKKSGKIKNKQDEIRASLFGEEW
jgi:hypothetical protein